MRLSGLVLLAVAGVAGCGHVDSSDVATDKMRAELELRSWDDGSAAMGLSLKARRPWRKWVFLSGDDALTANFRGEDVAMREEVVGKKHTYVAWFADVQSGEPITVSLSRGDGDDALSSTAELPPAMDMFVPDTDIDLGWDGIDVQWWPPSEDLNDQMTLDITGSCISNVHRRLDDTGSYFLPPGALNPSDEESPDSCFVELELRRERTGSLSDTFRGGEAMGVQIRQSSLWINAWTYSTF